MNHLDSIWAWKEMFGPEECGRGWNSMRSHHIHQLFLWPTPTLSTSIGFTLISAVGSGTLRKNKTCFAGSSFNFDESCLPCPAYLPGRWLWYSWLGYALSLTATPPIPVPPRGLVGAGRLPGASRLPPVRRGGLPRGACWNRRGGEVRRTGRLARKPTWSSW